MTTVEFKDAGAFEAMRAAERWLDARGFSVGSTQSDEPRAIWFGDCYISKWRGLSAQDKREMHAVMQGDMRYGPVRIRLLEGASAEARAAFALTDAEVAGQADAVALQTPAVAACGAHATVPIAQEDASSREAEVRAEMTLPKDGVNPYAEHPGFTGAGCTLRYTVTKRGAWGGVIGGFGCEITGGHCLPGDHCAKRREDAARQDALAAMAKAARSAAGRTPECDSGDSH